MDYRKIVDHLDLNQGDQVYLVSDIINLIVQAKKIGQNFDINEFIDSFLKKLGKNGTLIIPTFNWDFCKGITFDYLKTPTMTGSISKIAMKRKDFKRTTNPIYSFVIAGKDQKYLCDLQNTNCFGEDSPFHYFYINNVKFLSIGIDYKETGFAPVHYVEQKMKVNYRYFKKFSGKYIDEKLKIKNVNCELYVRDRSKVNRTAIRNDMDLILEKENVLKTYKIYNENFTIINLKIALDLMIKNIMETKNEDERLIYPMKKHRAKREKTNRIIFEKI